MQRAGNILKKFIKTLGLEAGVTLSEIRNHWIKIVGETIATHTSPDIIKGKTIFITVDTPQWMHHLSFFKHEIIEKLKPYRVAEIRFKLGKLSDEDSFRERTGIKQQSKNIPLTEEDLLYIENTVKSIKDDDLKERLRTLLKNALKTKR